jgi:hypothetical protein
MIHLNSEKQCIYIYRRRRRRMMGEEVEEEVEEEEKGGMAGGAGGREQEVSLGVIKTNTEIFHIFHIISHFNLLFFHKYFKYCGLNRHGKKYGKMKCFMTLCIKKASNVAFQTCGLKKVREKSTEKLNVL